MNGDGLASFNKLNLIRVPLRLGFDVFETGEISKEKKHMILQTMKAYAHLMNAYGVDKSIAVATSAMRDARNSDEVVRKIFLETIGFLNLIFLSLFSLLMICFVIQYRRFDRIFCENATMYLNGR